MHMLFSEGSSLYHPMRLALRALFPGIEPPQQPLRIAAPALAPVGIQMVFPVHVQDPPAEPQPHVQPTKEWKLRLNFTPDIEVLKKKKEHDKLDLSVDWHASLSIVTTDIIGLMREGLYVSRNNVQLQDNYYRKSFSEEDQMWYHVRSYSLTDQKWTGNLEVWSCNLKAIKEFRIEHLVPEKGCYGRAVEISKRERIVYSFHYRFPESNANYILDDAPMEGLWPWPRQELETQDNEILDFLNFIAVSKEALSPLHEGWYI